MPQWILTVLESSIFRYFITAESAEEAEEKFADGRFDKRELEQAGTNELLNTEVSGDAA